VVDSGNGRVVLLQDVSVLGTSGTSGTGLGQFQGALNIAVGSRGIYVADTGNNRIEKFDPVGLAAASATPFIPRFALSQVGNLNLSQPNSVATFSDLLQEELFIADTANNRIILFELPFDTPETVWNAMKQRLIIGDIDGATPYFASTTAENFRKGLRAIGSLEAASQISQIPAITAVFVDSDTAQYYFEQLIDGVMIGFPIDFVMEDGAWRIERF